MGKQLRVVNTKFGLVPERLSEASPSRPACAECSLHENCSEPFIKPYIPQDWTGQYLFVIETTKEGEESYRRNGLPVGERERVQLKALLSAGNIERNDVAFVPVLRCRPILTGSKKPKMVNLRACRPFLIRAINELNPSVVLAFGESAVKSLSNTGAPGPQALLRGRELPLQTGQPKGIAHFYCTHKLASTLVDPHANARIAEDLLRLTLPITAHPAKNIPSSTKGEIGFDTEYTGETVHCLAVADEHRAITVTPSTLATLTPLLSEATLVGHNIAVDIEALLRLRPKGLKHALERWLQGGNQRDTLLEARLSDENRGKYGYKLESLAVSLFNTTDWKHPTEALGPDSSKWPPQLRSERCRLDAWATLMVHKKLQASLVGPSRLSHAIAMSLRRMYWAGAYIDGEKFTKMRKTVYKERTESFQSLSKFADKFGIQEFTATDTQLREYVYGTNGVGLEVESYTKGGLPSVSVKHLKEYKNEKTIQALLTFSKWDKLKTTYCDSLATKFHRVKNKLWMPVSINPLAAKTGRRASSAPNMQNWPVSVRQIIVSRFNGGSIADNDYSKLEPILGGWVSGEHKLTEYFVKYPNGYIKIGEDFFKKTVAKNTKEYTAIKSLILGITYNKKKWSLADDMWAQGAKLDSNYESHIDKVGDMLEDFLDLFPGMRKYHQAQEEMVLQTGRIYNALGQCRRLPLPPEPPRGEKGLYRAWMRHKAHVINQAINYPIQSLAAYVTGCALIDIEREILREWKLSYVQHHTALMEKCWLNIPLLVVEVHDDLVQDIPKGLEKKTQEITHDIMTKPPSLFAVLPELWDSNVKLSVDTNIAPCWGSKT
jgi:uracil-DNA glycosylase family 4